MAAEPSPEFNPAEAAVLARYFTNLDRPIFALRNLPEVVKGALFSRYSRTEKSLRRVLLDEFINEPDSGFQAVTSTLGGSDDMVAVRRAEEFYERVLVGYGDDSVAELAGAHVAVERTSTLAAKALEDSRIGISPLEKSTRYVRFDRPGRDGRFLYHRGPELAHPEYEPAADFLFETYSSLVEPLTKAIRDRFPIEEGESDRAWKAATRAKALDMLRGLLPAGTLTNLGLFGNGRAFEYLITKLASHELPECRALAADLHRELALVIPAIRQARLDERYGVPAAERWRGCERRRRNSRHERGATESGPSVRLLEYDREAEERWSPRRCSRSRRSLGGSARRPGPGPGCPAGGPRQSPAAPGPRPRARAVRLRDRRQLRRLPRTCTATECHPGPPAAWDRPRFDVPPAWPSWACRSGSLVPSNVQPGRTRTWSGISERQSPSTRCRSPIGFAGTSG